ncbi:MAG TPA: glycosyltransferase family 2 protein [Patescibacteria group bacterium]|nr:glycosyltransferase family 2 protein [bacterium]HRY56678.1 glycosyltransferase family 2 protein [Patescibacteria group bacterium]
MKKISFIIVNYATKGLLEKNISNLLSIWENSEVIFIDNDSPDGSADFVEEKFGKDPRVISIRNQNNGLSAGYNKGLKVATGDYLVYLGTDSFPTKDAIEGMLKYMDENLDVGIVTPKLFTRDGAVDIDAHRGFPTPWASITHFTYLDRLFPKSRIFNQYSRKYQDFNTVHEIDACISHFMMVRPEVHKKVGGWDEDYFLFGEDIDFCYRTKQAGFKIMYMGNIPVLHYKGASVGRDTSKDIDNVMNTDFDKISFKGQVFGKESADGSFTVNNNGSLRDWMKKQISKESTDAMKTFYKKHFVKKYPFFLNWFVFLGIWVNEQIRFLKVFIKSKR